MEKYEGYQNREEFQDKTSRQLFDTHKEKLKNQNDQIGELVGVAKQGNKLATNLGDELKKQNVKLDKLDNEIEKTETKMSKTRKKFDEFIEKGSFCCLYIVILMEIIALFLVIMFV